MYEASTELYGLSRQVQGREDEHAIKDRVINAVYIHIIKWNATTDQWPKFSGDLV